MSRLLKVEKKIRNRENRELTTPHTPLEFEKALLVSPRSSYMWIRYAALMVETQNPESGREILKRALSKLDPTEEREKLNLHLALINLEEHYGDSESFEKSIENAMLTNNPELIYRHQIKKCIQRGDHDAAEEILNRICKKFNKNVENWAFLCEFFLKEKQDEDGFKDAMRRGLQSTKDSIELKKRIAVLEYEHGSQERGRTMFETLISDKPNRADL